MFISSLMAHCAIGCECEIGVGRVYDYIICKDDDFCFRGVMRDEVETVYVVQGK